jgi:AcrR family transcriptional regulator
MATQTREAIVAAAADLLDEGGPAAVTFRAVGDRVGLSHNAAFKLFHDKESLLAAVAGRELRRQAEALARARAPGSDPGAELRNLAHGYVRWAMNFPARFQLTFGRWEGPNDDLGEAATAARNSFVEAVRAAQSAGAIVAGDPDRIASLLLATVHGAADLALNGHLSRTGKGAADPDDLIDDLFGLLSRPVAAPDMVR